MSLISEWMPSYTLEDIIVALLHLFHHPNLESPFSTLTVDYTEEEFYRIHAKMMKGDVSELLEEYIIEDDFNEALDRYNDLRPEEWDVLTRAAKVAWSYQLEQEKWQTEIKQWEMRENERKCEEHGSETT